MVARLGVAARLRFKAHPHMFRHACGFQLANPSTDTRTLLIDPVRPHVHVSPRREVALLPRRRNPPPILPLAAGSPLAMDWRVFAQEGGERLLEVAGRHATFRENEIDESVLQSLTAEDLKELGVRAPRASP